MGVDPGLDITGYGIIETQKGESEARFIHGGFIKTQSRRPVSERLNEIYREITEVVEEFKPDTLVLEKLYSHYRHPITAILMGHARGVICLVCAGTKIPLISYSATRVKKAITGKGNASKYQVKTMVENLLSLNNLLACTDTSDALALAIAHVYISKVESSKRSSKIDWYKKLGKR